ncbi:MAG: LPS assembly protein LptD [Pseudomonadota bacterium]
MRVLALLLCLLPGTLFAQGAATLVADEVALNADEQLVANGNVEVLYDGARLLAEAIIYDRPSDSLQVVGPIFLETADGTLITANAATLDPRLENGILQGARLVLDQQLQLAASQIDRREGRYSQLYKSAATSCNVCGTRPPLWEIRAERIIHDQEELQLYFRNATFHVRGVPVFWLPRLRIPDPALERATGLLIPEQRNTTELGYGLKLPYFIVLGPSRDLTVTPYFSPETRTLELRYRQAFRRGRIEVNGAVSDDTLEEETRSYLFAEGVFDLDQDYRLTFDIETVSDPAYLLDYDYSEKDRLDSAIAITRVDARTLYQARFTYYQTLREDEANGSLPPIIVDLRYDGRQTAEFGGTLKYDFSLDTAYRYTNTDGEEGRDVTRGGVSGSWQETWISGGGAVLTAEVGSRADLYFVTDDSAFADEDLRIAPFAQVTLRWPLGLQTDTGVAHLIEPTVTLGWADTFGGTPPNEDSIRTELDRGNLLSLSRFAGEDAVETGLQGAAGLTWTRLGKQGQTASLAVGRVLREDTQDGFTASSGLDGQRSDWLLATQFTAQGGFLFDARGLWDGADGLTVADARIAWENARIGLGANYIWQSSDLDEDRDGTLSEWTVDAAFVLSDAWSLELDGRYNVAADKPVRGGIGLQWQNECVTIDVSASRRYTSSSTVPPTTTFGLSGTIGSFATGRARSGCRN